MKINKKILKRIATCSLAFAMVFGITAPASAFFATATPRPTAKARKNKVKKAKGKKKSVKKWKNITLAVGVSKTLSVKTNKKLKWFSSNRKVVTVKAKGKNKALIKAKKKGNAKVTAKQRNSRWIFNVKVKGKANKKAAGKSDNKKKASQSKQQNNNVNKEQNSLLERNAKAILAEAGIDNSMPDIQKFARLCRWWSNNIKYDAEEADATRNGQHYENEEKYSSILNKYSDEDLSNNYGAVRITELRKGVCGDQAAAIAYYCNLMGVKAKEITGTSHAWNHVYLDDGWYTFDAIDIIDSTKGVNSDGSTSLHGGNITLDDFKQSANYKLLHEKDDEHFKERCRRRGMSEDEVNSMYDRNKNTFYLNNYIYHLAKTSFDTGAIDNDGNPIYSDDYGNSDERYSKANWATAEQVNKYNAELNGKKYVNVILGDYI